MIQNAFERLILMACLLMITVLNSYSQGPWNSGSFQFSKDSTSLVDMTGAANIVFTGTLVPSSASIALASFDFQFGLKKYANFYVSPYGFISLGSPILSSNPEQDSTVIVPLFNGTYWNASYKFTGSAPDRRVVVEFAGVMQPSGEPTKYQIWLFERTGRIQFVYKSIRGFYGSAASYSYRIFCRTKILNQNTTAAIQVKLGNALPDISYTSVPQSFDSIYENTRFTWQPDTLKPATPSFLAFSNLQPGCLTLNFNDNSNNESIFLIEKADSVTNYKLEKYLYSSSPNGASVQTYSQTGLQPLWNYYYRVFASTGFMNSDTLIATIQTLPPQINGTKLIPGDYPSITALLQDVPCKHIGPDLVIELQSNYSFASEKLPIAFSSKIQNRLINSIVIRPAAGANITWSGATRRALFYVDSVKHVRVDGRSGGTGSNINLTITQQNFLGSIIQYANGADSGSIEFCKLILKTGPANVGTTAMIISASDSSFSRTGKDVNSFKLSNCIITTDSGMISRLLVIKAKDSSGCKNFTISNNQISRFNQEGIYFENGGEDCNISGNSFFQPVSFLPWSFLPVTASACIRLINLGKVVIDGNNFGGSTPVWGQGVYKMNSTSDGYNFIDYNNSSLEKIAIIRNNKFGNISSGSSGYVKMIYAVGGNVRVENNQFGTADSVNSITTLGSFSCVSLSTGKKSLINNFFSGIQAQYLINSGNIFDVSYFIFCTGSDSCEIRGNDIGGSNDLNANTAGGRIMGIYGLKSCMYVGRNQFRGFFSKRSKVTGIYCPDVGFGVERLMADSNNFHDLKGASDVSAIEAYVNSTVLNRASYNNIYGLYTTGEAITQSWHAGDLYGITMGVFNYPGYIATKGELEIFGNRINSFIPINVGNNAIYNLYGIMPYAAKSKVFNNYMRFGKDMRGGNIDTLSTGVTCIRGGNYIEHNSIFICGKAGLTTTGIYADDSAYVTNNIIQIDREGHSYAPHTFVKESNALVSKKNLWYSSTNSNVPVLLQNFKSTCNCDSSSFVGNPQFINPTGDSSSYDLHLSAGSKADSAGAPSVLNIQKDMDGKDRNNFSPVDIGCYAVTPGTPSTLILCPPVSSATLTSNIQGSTYQWQVNSGAGFANIKDSFYYANTNGATLQLQNIPSAWYGNIYRCITSTATSKLFQLKFKNTWTNAVNSNWENPANWSCNVLPDINTDVIISSGPVIVNSNVTIRSLTLSPAVNFTVTSGYTLTITH